MRYVSAGKVWAPENYDGKFRGPVTLQQALEESINVPTIRLLEQIGVKAVLDAAQRAGIRSPLPNDLTLALGSGDVTLLEITAAYGTFANQGVHMEPLMVRYVTDAQGRLVEENIPQGREAIDPAIANRLTAMLRGVVERGTAVAARVLERPLAGKTGTTNDFSNAWFVGYTPSLVAGVWVGHDRPRSLGTRRRAPAPRSRSGCRSCGRRSAISPSRSSPPSRRRRRTSRPRGPDGRRRRRSAARERGARPREEAGRSERRPDQRREIVVQHGGGRLLDSGREPGAEPRLPRRRLKAPQRGRHRRAREAPVPRQRSQTT